MRVKAAYFRFHLHAMGLPPATRITSLLRNAERDAWHAIGALRKPGHHDIEGWANLLVMKRASLAMPYAGPFANEFINRAAGIASNWREFMRYRSIRVFESEVRSVQSDADWFRRNYHLL